MWGGGGAFFFSLRDSVTFVGALALAVLVVLPNPVAAKKTKIGGARQEMTEFSLVRGGRLVSFFFRVAVSLFFLEQEGGGEGERFRVSPRVHGFFTLPFCLRFPRGYSIFCRCAERDARLASKNIRGEDTRFFRNSGICVSERALCAPSVVRRKVVRSEKGGVNAGRSDEMWPYFQRKYERRGAFVFRSNPSLLAGGRHVRRVFFLISLAYLEEAGEFPFSVRGVRGAAGRLGHFIFAFAFIYKYV